MQELINEIKAGLEANQAPTSLQPLKETKNESADVWEAAHGVVGVSIKK